MVCRFDNSTGLALTTTTAKRAAKNMWNHMVSEESKYSRSERSERATAEDEPVWPRCEGGSAEFILRLAQG